MGTKKIRRVLAPHLGGHNNRTWTDEGALCYMIKECGITSMLDIGCGPGGQLDVARRCQLDVLGVDGDFAFENCENVQIFDFAKAKLDEANISYIPEQGHFDFGWCVEFLEHVEETYIDNYMSALALCKYVVITHATKGQGGYHHVNEQPSVYWFEKFKNYGFIPSAKLTKGIRKFSTMGAKLVDYEYLFDEETDIVSIKTHRTSFIQKNGWCFVNQAMVQKHE